VFEHEKSLAIKERDELLSCNAMLKNEIDRLELVLKYKIFVTLSDK